MNQPQQQTRPAITPAEFAERWANTKLGERQGYQAHWNDLCDLLGQPKPTDGAVDDADYCFEKPCRKADTTYGYVDVWRRGHFAVEYKKPGKSLDKAFSQLIQYRLWLDNPPLLVVSDLQLIRVVTNFQNAKQFTYDITPADIASGAEIAPVADTGVAGRPVPVMEVLRRAFTDPDWFKPGRDPVYITKQASAEFATIAAQMKGRGVDPRETAHFLMKVLFCLFAEDVGVLKDREFRGLFERIYDSDNGAHQKEEDLRAGMEDLFRALATGTRFHYRRMVNINGGLFDDKPAIKMMREEIKALRSAATLDWSLVEPAIFGTLFERSLDEDQRKRLGAHYTSPDDIKLVVEPVVLRPLRREWAAVLEGCAASEAELRGLLSEQEALGGEGGLGRKHQKRLDELKTDLFRRYREFHNRLLAIRVLDPACGSGNFLYVAMTAIKGLELDVLAKLRAVAPKDSKFEQVHPRQFLGMEINPYAHELAQTVIWIGFLQWWRDHFGASFQEPVLQKLDTIQCTDALLVLDEDGKPEDPPRMTEWPEAEFIVGNPPFLGSKLLRKQLGDEYMTLLQRRYGDLVSGEGDLSVYWHERARQQIAARKTKRAGLLATQGIRGKRNRQTLSAILESGGIFEAWADRQWTLDGAAVQISIVCQDDGADGDLRLDGAKVGAINSDLTTDTDLDLSGVAKLAENAGLSFMGVTKQGPFDIDRQTAEEMWKSPNPHKRSNREVVRPFVNGRDIAGRRVDHYLIDIPEETEEAAALWETPFEYVLEIVKPWRAERQRDWFKKEWWQLYARRPGMWSAIGEKGRYIVTTTVSKHRLFKWLSADMLPDHQLIVFARDDDYFFGVLHSTLHELWALRLGTQLEDRPRYTPTTCFETFPLPKPTKAQEKAIAAAAKELNDLREAWLNPAELVAAAAQKDPGPTSLGEFAKAKRGSKKRGSDGGPPSQAKRGKGAPADPEAQAGSPQHTMSAIEAQRQLAKRTLTNLYNERPMWLHHLHVKLDRAVLAAYGWNDIDVDHLHAMRVAPTMQTPKGPRPATGAECAAMQKAAETEVLRRLLGLNEVRRE